MAVVFRNRATFGPNGTAVADLLSQLALSTSPWWHALVDAQLELLASDPGRRERKDAITEGAGMLALRRGEITVVMVEEAKAKAEAAAASAAPECVRRIAPPPEKRDTPMADFQELMRAGANSAVTILMLRPFIEPEEFDEIWAPYRAAVHRITS